MRRLLRSEIAGAGAAAIRRETHEVMTRVKERVEALLAAGG